MAALRLHQDISAWSCHGSCPQWQRHSLKPGSTSHPNPWAQCRGKGEKKKTHQSLNRNPKLRTWNSTTPQSLNSTTQISRNFCLENLHPLRNPIKALSFVQFPDVSSWEHGATIPGSVPPISLLTRFSAWNDSHPKKLRRKEAKRRQEAGPRSLSS